MSVWEILLLAVALSMDACAVAMTNGMSNSKMGAKSAVTIGVFFGFFQFLMPLIGYFITGVVANAFLDTFKSISSWVSFALLAFLGGRMIFECVKEWRSKKTTEGFCEECSVSPAACPIPNKVEKKELQMGQLVLQAIATSIDALAVGVTLQMASLSPMGLALGVWGATGAIGITTFLLSVGAVYIGKAMGDKLADKASFAGGVVLVCIGLKLLFDGLL